MAEMAVCSPRSNRDFCHLRGVTRPSKGELLFRLRDRSLSPEEISKAIAVLRGRAGIGGQDLLCDLKEYTIVIGTLGRFARWGEALELLQELAPKGLEPSVITLNAALAALASGRRRADQLDNSKEGPWGKSLHLLSRMEQQMLEPDKITYSAVISACEKGYQWTLALGLLGRAVGRSDVKMDVILCSAVISACEKCARWEQALQLLQKTSVVRV
mmetsp:Transcript_95011/g.171570  ORF Transcript_95011/g.171570 Transcript_95011/m.171570 type:complete len:215 (-) Transcript_95011:9-653(-)